jgi:hypothetical protein
MSDERKDERESQPRSIMEIEPSMAETRSLRIGTFNCQGVMRSAPYISFLLNSPKLDLLVLCQH